MTAAPSHPPSLPDITPLRFRKDTDLAAWLVKLWHTGFGDGNELADLLCKPLGNAGLTFANDIDELLRVLRVGPCNSLNKKPDGAGWLVQEKWTAHLSEFGQSREAFLGSFGGVSFRDLEGDHARFHASCYGFTPNRECQAYREFVAGWEAERTYQLKRASWGFNTSSYAPGKHSGPNRSDKGEKGKACNVTTCQLPNSANWYNHSTRKYYCQTCASALNRTNADFRQTAGHDLCTEEPSPTPTPPPVSGDFNVGDKVKLTPKFLTNTGQRGSEEAKRTWKVQPCQCMSGKTVAVDQERESALGGGLWFTAVELAAQPCLKWRHIAVANLKKVS